jgi:hypothetical protein
VARDDDDDRRGDLDGARPHEDVERLVVHGRTVRGEGRSAALGRLSEDLAGATAASTARPLMAVDRIAGSSRVGPTRGGAGGVQAA